MRALDRFLRYVTYHTTSERGSETSPSTERQLVFARALREEMEGLGLEDLQIDGNGNLIGTLPARGCENAPVVGFISHMDTTPQAPGENVSPRIVRYIGEPVELCPGVMLSEEQLPELEALRGQELVVTDGTTLLGSDDKAGIAEIMTMVEALAAGDAPHGELRIIFTTDEEVGRGTEGLDVAALGCDYAYTVDGGPLGDYCYECFHAGFAQVILHGTGTHSANARGLKVHAATTAMKLHALLPALLVAEKTEGREGYISLLKMEGTATRAELKYLFRDHDRALYEEKKRWIQRAVAEINQLYGERTAELARVSDSYKNMRDGIEPEHLHLVERIKTAYEALGIPARRTAARGCTDGAMLTEKGLPCPDIGTGGYNIHSVREFIPVESLEAVVQVLLHIVGSFVE